MANRSRALNEAAQIWYRSRIEIGAELREARLAGGLSLGQTAAAVGSSASQLCRVEHGRVESISARGLIRHGAAVGLRISIKAYPVGGALRDAAQARYVSRFVQRIGSAWDVRLEVPVPMPGDLRAADIVLRGGGVSIAVEVITRLRDLQAQLRAATQKQRDLRASRLVIVLAATHANRRTLAEARLALVATFDLDTRVVLGALAAGRDPGRDAIILL